jgi:hypothetical protein
MSIRRGQKHDEASPEKLPAQAGPKPVANVKPAQNGQKPGAQAPAADVAAVVAVPAQPTVENTQDQIRRLASLRQMGVLNNEEFENLTTLLLDLPRK